MADLCKRPAYQGGPHERQSGWCGLCNARADSRPHTSITSRQRRRQAARDQQRIDRRTA